jgi:hypothetical protein
MALVKKELQIGCKNDVKPSRKQDILDEDTYIKVNKITGYFHSHTYTGIHSYMIYQPLFSILVNREHC